MMTRTFLASLAVVGLLSSRTTSAEDPLTAIKGLYESAAYEDALAALDRIAAGDAAAKDQGAIELRKYRALCLLALARVDDAERVIEGLLVENPQYQPDSEASPRWVAAVSRVRSRIAPAMIRRRYAEGKRHFDAKAFAPAADDFKMVLTLLEGLDPESSAGERLTDLGTLSRGFLELTRAAMEGSPKSTPATTGSVASAPAATPATTAPPVGPATKPESPVATVVASPVGGSQASPGTVKAPEPGGWIAQFTRLRVYSASDAGITPPVAVRQELPPWRLDVRSHFTGEIEVLVSETGDVEAAILRKPVHPLYDGPLVEAAGRWKYEPARKDGAPVKFRKVLRINLGPN